MADTCDALAHRWLTRSLASLRCCERNDLYRCRKPPIANAINETRFGTSNYPVPAVFQAR